MFACEHEAVQPDLMCLGKGLTGGYLPLAATLASQQIFDAFLGEGRTFFHGHTYTGNPLACAAALASLDLFEKHDLVARASASAHELARTLEALQDLPHVGQVRQKGLMVGIELVRDRKTRRPFDPAWHRSPGLSADAPARRHLASPGRCHRHHAASGHAGWRHGYNSPWVGPRNPRSRQRRPPCCKK